jgi:hypothetical protein
MKGWRTLVTNAIFIGLTSILTFLLDVDWTQYVDPTVAILIIGLINLFLRTISNTAIGRKQ